MAIYQDTSKSLYWVKALEGYETGGNCPVDFIHLHDGRVIGVDGECAVLYDSMTDFMQFETRHRETINFLGGFTQAKPANPEPDAIARGLINQETDRESRAVNLAVEIGALKYACTQALALLQDGDATDTDARKVEKLLEAILEGTS